MTIRVAVLALVLAALLSGCGDRKEEPASKEPAVATQKLDAFKALRGDLVRLKEAGLNDEVVARLEKAMTEPELEKNKPAVFRLLLGEYILSGMTNKAEEAYMAAVDDGKTNLVEAAGGIVGTAYVKEKNYTEAIEWGNKLLGKDIPANITAQVLGGLVTSYAASDRAAEIAEKLPAIMALKQDERVGRLLRSIASLLRRSGKHEILDSILKSLDEGYDGKPWLKVFVRLTTCDSFLDQRRWQESEKLLMGNVRMVPDGDLSSRFSRLVSGLHQADRGTDVDRICKNVIANLKGVSLTRASLAALWIRLSSGDKAAFLKRIAAVLDSGIASPGVVSSFEGGFYELMSTGTSAQRKQCRDLGDRLRNALPGDKRLNARLTLLELDAAFYLNDFKRALEIVTTGVEGMDEEWHSVLANKISAHLALAENRPLDAIKFFRKHMERVAVWERPQPNPENSVMMEKEAVLGYNEKRIGDIFKSMGRTDDANAAYAKARDYYEKALTIVKADTPEYTEYSKELAAVPKALVPEK
ncbi:MAG: hypothetical protein QGI24_06730 [Kiritimatiellia bacterium]|jgi:tetratricopeptide (TPR) repeat protein|nr:hypothetical protein [Kiritimatiellia bacterium]